MGNADAKGSAASNAAATRNSGRRPSLPGFNSKRRASEPKIERLPTDAEASLATRLAKEPRGVKATGPPFYAVSGSWLAAWHAFVLSGCESPGPISNAALVETTPSSSEEAVWLSADDWHLIHGVHGGGPVLCRASQTLASTGGGASSSGAGVDMPSSEDWRGGPRPQAALSAGGVDPAPSVALVQRAAREHATRCRRLEQDLVSKIEILEKGLWGKRRSSLGAAFRKSAADEARATARQRLAQAVTTNCGGEELRVALQELREAGDAESAAMLEPLVAELCVHEEAQIVLACLLQALQDADRISLELWLEQADAMGLEALIADVPQLLGPLHQHLMDLQECERGALKQHAHAAELNNEGPSERMWRISVAAYEEKDDATLADLIQESRSIGLDVSAVELLQEELLEQRAAQERATRRPSWAYRSESKEPKDGAPPGPSHWGNPDSWATPGSKDWKDPATWGSTEDFLDAWRKWKQQDRERQYGAEEAERMRQKENEDLRRDERERTRQREEDNRRKEYFERERKQREEEEERRNKQRYAGYQSFHGPFGSTAGPGGFYSGANTPGGYSSYSSTSGGPSGGFRGFHGSTPSGGYGSSYSQQQRQAPPPARAGPSDTGQALRALGFPAVGRVPPLSELKSAYKKAAMRAHPDRPHNRGRQAEATAEFQKVKAAFDQLAESAPPG